MSSSAFNFAAAAANGWRAVRDQTSCTLQAGVLITICLLSWVTYNFFFHPLSKYPGPRACAVSTLPFALWLVRGKFPLMIHRLHEEYGEVVRIAPNKLSYISSQAWQDIAGARKHGQLEMPKDPRWYCQGANGPDIVNCDQVTHRRFRKAFAHGFSDRSLRLQEPLIQQHITVLIDQLTRCVLRGEPMVNVVKWMECALFDMTGDLTFGETFDCLETGNLHPWFQDIFGVIRAWVLFRLAQEMMPEAMLKYAIPLTQRLMSHDKVKKYLEHEAFTRDKLVRRMSRQNDPEQVSDLLDPILRKPPGERMTFAELLSNSFVFILAGGETTASALSAMLYLLLSNPKKMKNLVVALETAFPREEMITIETTSQIPYLHAVIEESLRLYPPIPSGSPRCVPKGGAMIDRQYLPEGISVRVTPFAVFHSRWNFKRPEEFLPERFLYPEEFGDNLDAMKPFGVGPRNCIGMTLAYAEMQLILCRLLYHFDFQLANKSDGWLRDQLAFEVWDKPPLYVQITPRARPNE